MLHALYRRRGQHDDLALTMPGNELDFAALDAAAARRWGGVLIRIASWVTSSL